MAMAGIDHGNPGGKVDVSLAFHVPDLRVQGAFDIDLSLHSNAAGDGAFAPLGDFCVQHSGGLHESGNMAREKFDQIQVKEFKDA